MRLIFQSYTVPELRVLARNHNKEVKIAGINKMKKPELIEAMMKHEDKFKKVQMKVKAKVVKAKVVKTPKKVYDTETDVSDDDEPQKKEPVKKQRKKAVKKEEMKVKAKVVKSPAGRFGFKKKATPVKSGEEDKDNIKKEIFDIEGKILGFELANKDWKQFLKDFKAGKTKFGGKIKLGDYEGEKNKLKKQLDDTRIFSSKILADKDLNNKSEFYKGLVKSFISERNKITRLYNKAKTRFNNLTYLIDFESK